MARTIESFETVKMTSLLKKYTTLLSDEPRQLALNGTLIILFH